MGQPMFPMPMKPTRITVHRLFGPRCRSLEPKRDSSTASRTRKRRANCKTMRDFARNDDSGFAQSFEAELFQNFSGVVEAINARRHSGIDHAVQEHFTDFILGE